ncbi:MAG: selenocysteine-specific translation elongation factor [Thermodesulfobacteriota bacterium]
MKQLVLGTAGHIDHGKTSLVRALTGIDTDRLKEEKARGITIELGFAFLDLPSGQRLGIVDVPGHEKFVKNMVAGATGIDLVALVIAADEGVMPQTREHLDICSLLGVHAGLVVLTKIDMVDAEWLELVQEDIREYLAGSFLENAPLAPVSAVTGQGVPELVALLDQMAARLEERPAHGPFRLPVDRVFSMKGFGTVITGTAIGGALKVGEEVEIYPRDIKAKVRGLQVHNADVNEARRGQRTAVNLQGIEKAVIERGDVVATPGSLKPSLWLDLDCASLKDMARPLKHRAPVRFHTGAVEIMGRVMLLDRDELKPGETCLCQVRLEAPVAVMAGDRYVLRSYSPVYTVAGGVILHPHPGRHKRGRADIMADLAALKTGAPAERIAVHARLAGPGGITAPDLVRLANIAPRELDKLLTELLTKQQLIRFDKEGGRLVAAAVQQALVDQALALLIEFHAAQPLKPGMSREEFKQRLGAEVDQKLFAHLLRKLTDENKVEVDKDLIRLAGHQVRLAGGQEALRARMEKAWQEGGWTPPLFKEFAEKEDQKQAKQVLQVLINEGVMVKVKEDLYFHSAALNEIKQKMVEFFADHERMAAQQFKELTGLSRKYLIPLMEHFDATQVTIRVGDERMLRRR